MAKETQFEVVELSHLIWPTSLQLPAAMKLLVEKELELGRVQGQSDEQILKGLGVDLAALRGNTAQR